MIWCFKFSRINSWFHIVLNTLRLPKKKHLLLHKRPQTNQNQNTSKKKVGKKPQTNEKSWFNILIPGGGFMVENKHSKLKQDLGSIPLYWHFFTPLEFIATYNLFHHHLTLSLGPLHWLLADRWKDKTWQGKQGHLSWQGPAPQKRLLTSQLKQSPNRQMHVKICKEIIQTGWKLAHPKHLCIHRKAFIHPGGKAVGQFLIPKELVILLSQFPPPGHNLGRKQHGSALPAQTFPQQALCGLTGLFPRNIH